jgi:hypothetical protein
MNKKRKFFIIILLVALVGGFLVYNNYSKKESSSVQPSPPGSSGPSVPSRCSLVAKNDTYAGPDFERLKNVMQEQQIVKDIPTNGKISLKFFHFTEGCRIYDKSYILSGGKITESTGTADIYLTLSSAYVDRITKENFCEIITEARNNGDLGQKTEIGKATLLWRYKSMLKYKDCLGVKF